MKTLGIVLLAAVALPGCMVVPLAEPVPVYAAPRPVVVHPYRYDRGYAYRYHGGPRYGPRYYGR